MSRKTFHGPNCIYHETRCLGQGGFGVAYLAKTADDMNKEYVIKIHKTVAGKNLYNLAKEESDKLRHFDHKNLAKLVEAFDEEIDGKLTHVIVLEYCNSGDLDQYIRLKGGKEEYLSEYIDIFEQIWEGVHSLHTSAVHPSGKKKPGLCHSDLKPGNVFLHKQNVKGARLEAKVGDLGVATWLPDGDMSVLVGGAGTLLYMPPERLTLKKFGKKSDLYALGVIFYEMLTKHLPYYKEEEIKSMTTLPRFPLPDWVPADLKQFVLKLMSKNKMERPQALPSNKIKKTYPTNGATYEGEVRRWIN